MSIPAAFERTVRADLRSISFVCLVLCLCVARRHDLVGPHRRRVHDSVGFAHHAGHLQLVPDSLLLSVIVALLRLVHTDDLCARCITAGIFEHLFLNLSQALLLGINLSAWLLLHWSRTAAINPNLVRVVLPGLIG